MFSQAASFINHTSRNLFLTGKAGTGKTTFLRHIKEHCAKKLAVIAPTGVAAINAGGTTIHSFFLLPWGTFLPANTMMTDVSEMNRQVFTRPQLKAKMKLDRRRLATIRELELLIIDEISMVRADMLDAIDFVLKTVRHNHSQPFGGVQMLFIGDMMQLPPVLNNEDETLLRPYYKSPYFFDAQVIAAANPLYIELKKIYRQSNEDFISLLNKIRQNTLTDDDLAYLNSFYRPDFTPRREDEYITLSSHNYIADRINQTELDNLDQELHEFEAVITRDFPERMYPTDKTLYLKKGAQVMFIKNDKGDERRYYNGKIGTIVEFKKDEIEIHFKNETEPLFLKQEKWQNIKYSYSADSDNIEEEELGTFSQYPLRLAWAITIHKSQGLTFERAIIDAGASFTSGQVYVALSRLSNLDGLVLRSRISSSSISTDTKVVDYSNQDHNEENLPNILEREQVVFIHDQVLKTFEWNKGYIMFREYVSDKKSRIFDEEDQELFADLDICLKKLSQQKETAEKFNSQLQNILPKSEGESCDYDLLHNRANSAVIWFSEGLSKDIIKPLEQLCEQLKKARYPKREQKEARDLLLFFERKKQQLMKVTDICAQLTQSHNVTDVLTTIDASTQSIATEAAKPKEKLKKGDSHRESLKMYQEGKSVEEIAKERNLTTQTIEGHLTSFIPTGETKVEDFVSPEKMNVIIDFYRNNPDSKNSSAVKHSLGDDYSYMEIKAVMMSIKSG
jgi:predicted ATPase